MSGLCGIADLAATPPTDHLDTMLFMMSHRGSGAPGTWINGHVALGFWDLETLDDHRRAPQPWADPATGMAILADARIDNRDDLVAELQSIALPEPELIMLALSRWGVAAFGRLVGDFAIALWNESRRTLLLARDPMGVKPLYYHHDGHRLLFASEAKALLAVPGVPRRPSLLRLEEVRAKRLRRKEPTFFEHMDRVWPGECLEFSSRGIRRRLFWSPELGRKIRHAHSRDYQAEFRKLFFEAVRCRLPENKPAAILLSGGMDSSAIACVVGDIRLRERPAAKLATFSWESAGLPDLRDSSHDVVDHWGFQHTAVDVDSIDAAEGLRSLVFEQESPRVAYDANLYKNLLSRVQASGARVVLMGDGGDELMQSRAYLADLLLQHRWGDLARHMAGIRRQMGPLALNFFKYALWYLLLPRRQTPPFRSRAAREVHEGLLEPIAVTRREELERQAARSGLEPRFPFLDLRLVEFVLAIPGEERSGIDGSKRLAREGLADLIPDAVRSRPKNVEEAAYMVNALHRSFPGVSTLGGMASEWEDLTLQTWHDTWFGSGDRADRQEACRTRFRCRRPGTAGWRGEC